MAENFKKTIFNFVYVLVLFLVMFFALDFTIKYYYKQSFPLEYEPQIRLAAIENDLPIELIYAVMRTESGFKEQAQSSVGARGLMQITQSTFEWAMYRKNKANELDYDMLFKPDTNIEYGAYILKLLIDEFGTVNNGLAAYHAGFGNVTKWLADKEYSSDGKNLNVIPFYDTAGYVKKVNNTALIYKNLYKF